MSQLTGILPLQHWLDEDFWAFISALPALKSAALSDYLALQRSDFRRGHFYRAYAYLANRRDLILHS